VGDEILEIGPLCEEMSWLECSSLREEFELENFSNFYYFGGNMLLLISKSSIINSF